jgi:hypothetical protein
VKLPEHIFGIVRALHAANLSLANGNDDQRRILQQKIVETAVFRHPGEGWGRPPSKDAIANNKIQPGHLLSWDCFDGSTRQPAQRDGETIDGQVFIEMQGVDHLNGIATGSSGQGGATSGHGVVGGGGSIGQLPPRGEFFAALTWLDGVYRSQLGRPGGVDLEGIAAHLFDLYLNERLRGTSPDGAKQRVIAGINSILGRTDIHV